MPQDARPPSKFENEEGKRGTEPQERKTKMRDGTSGGRERNPEIEIERRKKGRDGTSKLSRGFGRFVKRKS